MIIVDRKMIISCWKSVEELSDLRQTQLRNALTGFKPVPVVTLCDTLVQLFRDINNLKKCKVLVSLTLHILKTQ